MPAPRSFGKKRYADGGSVSDDRRFRQMEDAEREATTGEKPEPRAEPQRSASLMDRAVGAVKRAVGLDSENTMSAPRNYPKKKYADGGLADGGLPPIGATPKPLGMQQEAGGSALGGTANAGNALQPNFGMTNGPGAPTGASMGGYDPMNPMQITGFAGQPVAPAGGTLAGTATAGPAGGQTFTGMATRPAPPAPMPAGPPMGGRPMAQQPYADGGKVKKQNSGKGGKFVPFQKGAPKASKGKGPTPKGFEKPTEKGNVIRAFSDGGCVTNKRDMGKRR